MTASFEGRIDGELLATSKPWLTFRCDEVSGTQQTWGTQLIFDAEPADLHDVDAEIEVEVVDLSGVTLNASLLVHIIDPKAE